MMFQARLCSESYGHDCCQCIATWDKPVAFEAAVGMICNTLYLRTDWYKL